MLKASWPRVRKRFVRDKAYWECDGRPRMKQEYFETKELADRRRNEMRQEIIDHGVTTMITHRQRLEYLEAIRLLKDTGKTLLDAVNGFMSYEKSIQKRDKITMDVAVKDWLKNKKDGMDKGEIAKTTEMDLRYIAKRYILPNWSIRHLSSITTSELARWMDTLGSSPRTKVNIRVKFGQFFNWCKLRGMIESNPLETIKITVKQAEVSVLTVPQCTALMNSAFGDKEASMVYPYVLLGLFLGLRPGEARQLTWEDIEPHQVTIRKEITKTRQRRYIPLDDKLWKALKEYQDQGVICGSNWRKTWDEVKARAGWNETNPWPSDVMRHTFASYHLAKYQNRSMLAELMGNSESVIRKHYRRAIPKEEAEKFWTLIHL